jgi:hypothetical protein
MLVHITFQLVTIWVASYFQIETDWYYYKVGFLATTMSPLWHFLSVKAIFGVAPVVSLFMGVTYFLIYINVLKDRPGLLKLIFIWASLHSFNKFFGDFIGGNVAFQFSDKFLGFLYVANWMFISSDIKNWISIICLIILTFIGYFSTRYFLSTAYSKYFLFNNRMKLSFKVNTIFLPAVIGTLIIFFIRLPIASMEAIIEFLSYNVYELISYLTMIFMLVPTFASYNSQLDLAIQTVSEERKQYIEWRYFVFVIILYAVFRILLDPNLGFGLHFNATELVR